MTADDELASAQMSMQSTGHVSGFGCLIAVGFAMLLAACLVVPSKEVVGIPLVAGAVAGTVANLLCIYRITRVAWLPMLNLRSELSPEAKAAKRLEEFRRLGVALFLSALSFTAFVGGSITLSTERQEKAVQGCLRIGSEYVAICAAAFVFFHAIAWILYLASQPVPVARNPAVERQTPGVRADENV